MAIRRSRSPAQAGSRWILGISVVLLLLLTAFAGPTVASGPTGGSSPVAPTSTWAGVSRLTLGINAGPGAAQDVGFAAGVQYYRLGITFNNGTIQGVNEGARTDGVDYLGVLSGSTLGVVRGGAAYHLSCVSNCHWTLSDWNATVRRALMDYPTIHEWELWNEAYSPTQWSGYLTGASSYFTMVKSAYTIIKAHDANDTVVCLGGSAVADAGAYDFTKTFWGYGAGRYCDAISLHAYVSGNALFSTDKYEATEWPKNLEQFETLTGKPIWITEFGRQSAEAHTGVHYSQQNQNEFLVQAMGIFQNLSFVKRAYVYTLAGLSNPPDNTDFGLLNATTLKPKLAWSTFLDFYQKSASHPAVPLVKEAAPVLSIAHLTIARLLTDKVSVTDRYAVDPVEILVNGVVKAKGTGSISYLFSGSLLKGYTITAYDVYTGLKTTETITVV
jgi:hypothetical protein